MSKRKKSVDELLLEIAQTRKAAPTLTLMTDGRWCCAVGVKFTAVTDGVFFTESMYLDDLARDTPGEAVRAWMEQAEGKDFEHFTADQVILDMENDPEDGRAN